MKQIFTILSIIIFSLTSYSQNNWTTKSYKHLKYSYPSNWTESEYLNVNNNISYGAQYMDIGEIAQFSVIETPNATGINNAHNISNDDMRTVIKNLFSPNSYFEKIENRKIGKSNAKYAKVAVTGSNGKNLSAINYIVFYDSKMIIIQGIYTTKQENKYLSILQNIMKDIEVL